MKLEPISTYGWGANAVSVYLDRVELRGTSYPITDIDSAELSFPLLVQKTFSLRLKNGQQSLRVYLTTRDANECEKEVTQLVSDLNASTGDGGGVAVSCTVLGGTGTHLVNGRTCTATFGDVTVTLVSEAEKREIKFAQLTSLTVDGPGRVTSDAGVSGGGFGLEGAALGVGVASLINALTTATTTNTILYLAWPGAEVFLHTSRYTPDQARLALSHAFTVVQSARNTGRADIASQLERIGALRDSGHLTPDEYVTAKARLLAPPR